MVVPWYIISTYAYHVEDDPIISDARYDRLSRMMLENWKDIDHKHKEFIVVNKNQNGALIEEYPKQTKIAVQELRSVCNGKKR